MISQAVPATSPSIIFTWYFPMIIFFFLKLKMKLQGQHFDRILKKWDVKDFGWNHFLKEVLLDFKYCTIAIKSVLLQIDYFE